MAKKNKKPEHYWQYRILTSKNKYGRTFSIAEVYFDFGKPTGYGDKSILQDYETVKILKDVHKKIKRAFKKPILDADNNLKKYKK